MLLGGTCDARELGEGRSLEIHLNQNDIHISNSKYLVSNSSRGSACGSPLIVNFVFGPVDICWSSLNWCECDAQK